MRGELLLTIALLTLTVAAAEELNTTTYVTGDNFSLDNKHFSITGTYDDGIGIDIDGWGRILAIDDCYETITHTLCVEDADNLSTAITFYSKDYTLTLDRTIPTTGDVREELRVELALTLEAPTPINILLNETTNMTVLSTRGFTHNLTWEGTMQPRTTKRFSYIVEALTAGEYTFFGNATGGVANATSEADVTISDDIDVTIDVVHNATRNTPYNLTITTTNNLNPPPTITVEVYVPQHINITDAYNLSQKNATYLRKSTNSTGTHPFIATYTLLRDSTTPLIIDVTTQDDDITRRYHVPVRESWLRPIMMSYTLPQDIIAQQNNTLTIKLNNPNNRSVDIDLSLIGALIEEEEEDLTLAANNTINRTFVFVPNETISTYGVQAVITYEDDHDNTLTQTTTIEFQATNTPTKPPTTPLEKNNSGLETPTQSLTLTAVYDDGLIIIDVYTPTLTNANITVSRDNHIITQQDVVLEHNNTLTQELTTPGTYTITVQASGEARTATITIPEPSTNNTTSTNDNATTNNNTSEEPVKNTAQNILMAGAAFVAFTTILYFIIGSRRARARRLEKRLRKEQRLLAQDEEFLHDFLPVTTQDLHLQRELATTIQERQQALSALEEVLRLLRKR